MDIYEKRAASLSKAYDIKMKGETTLARVLENYFNEYFSETDLKNILMQDGNCSEQIATHAINTIKNKPLEEINNKEIDNPISENTSVEPLHTMETDTQKIHGYGAYREVVPDPNDHSVHRSTQSDTLSNTPRLADAPTYQPPQPETVETPQSGFKTE